MSELLDAFSRDPEAIERLQQLVESMKEEAKISQPLLAAVLEHVERAPAEPLSPSELEGVIRGSFLAGRKQGADQCSDAIFGTADSEHGLPPQLQVLMGGLET
jgi:hypothetical protein